VVSCLQGNKNAGGRSFDGYVYRIGRFPFKRIFYKLSEINMDINIFFLNLIYSA